jgi:hypothetical protein
MFRNGVYVGLALALLIGLWLLWLWQPERQINRHADNLFGKIERKDWSGTSAFIGVEYLDQWGEDRALLLTRMRTAFSYIRDAKIRYAAPTVEIEKRRAVWRAKITLEGGDSELTAILKERVNSLATPFELEWHQVSGKPWDWKLTSVRNQDLELPAGEW